MSFSAVDEEFRVDWTIRALVLCSSSQNVQAATTCLFEQEETHNFQRRIAKRATMILGPSSKHRITQVRPDWPLVFICIFAQWTVYFETLLQRKR